MALQRHASMYLFVDAARCDGCGACVAACPNGAIALRDGLAEVVQALCRGSEACIAACPRAAIYTVTEAQVDRAPVLPAVAGPVEVALTGGRGLARLAIRALPALGTTLAFVGRELLLRAADALLERWSRGADGTAAPGGGRHRHRHGIT